MERLECEWPKNSEPVNCTSKHSSRLSRCMFASSFSFSLLGVFILLIFLLDKWLLCHVPFRKGLTRWHQLFNMRINAQTSNCISTKGVHEHHQTVFINTTTQLKTVNSCKIKSPNHLANPELSYVRLVSTWFCYILFIIYCQLPWTSKRGQAANLPLHWHLHTAVRLSRELRIGAKYTFLQQAQVFISVLKLQLIQDNQTRGNKACKSAT